jgi:uncharacterized protein with PhoU and TrkA domain
VALLVLRGEEAFPAPADDFVLAPDDQLLLVGQPVARRLLDAVLRVDAAGEYVVTGHRPASGWLWRRFTAARF